MEEPTFWPDHMHPDDRDWVMDFCANATREGDDHQFEYRMIAADGSTVWFRDIVTVDRQESGPEGIFQAQRVHGW